MSVGVTTRSIDGIRELYRYRSLLLALTGRDLRVRYAQSLLGFVWALALPLAMMLVFTFVFTKAINVSALWDLRMPYALFAYAGLVPWTFFATSLNNCTLSLTANRSLVTKISFPREVLPLSCIAGSLVDFCIALTVLFGLMFYCHGEGAFVLRPAPSWLFVPLIVLVQVLFTAGLGMILSAGHLYYRDVRPLFSVVIQLWMFLSGVVVPVPKDGSWAAELLGWNPMLPVISAYRSCLLAGTCPKVGDFAYAAAVSLSVFLLGWWGFRRASRRFAEQI